MGGASSWYAILAISAFFTGVWIVGRASMHLGVSSIVLEITMGIVLGPSVLKLIPPELSECYAARTTDCSTRPSQEHIAHEGTKFCDLQAYLDAGKYAPGGAEWSTGFFGGSKPVVELHGHGYSLDGHTHNGGHRRLAGGNAGKVDYNDYSECLVQQCGYDLAMRCAETPDIFTIIGHTGVAMMIFESGMHFDFEQSKKVGPWACVIAVLGTILPLASGAGLAVAFGYKLNPDGLAVGVSLAPTSVGIALKLLHEAKALHLPFGQAVMTAAFVDDVLSLIIFSVLFSLGGDMSFMTFFPLIMGCLFMVVAVILAVTFWPKAIQWTLAKFDGTRLGSKVSRRNEVLWVLMFGVLLLYAEITHRCGTHLWGCFIAGMSFATQEEAHHVWVRQVKRVSCWFIRIFFASTLAWSIPLEQLLSLTALWQGTLLGLGPCILAKVLCAPFMGKPRWVIGWAMVGRAEFAYFIAIMAKSLKMVDEKLFAVLIWSLIYATVFAPLIFRFVLKRYMKAEAGTTEPGAAEAETAPAQGNTDNPARGRTVSDIVKGTSGILRNASDIKMTMQCHAHLPDLYAEREEEKVAQKVRDQDAEISRLRRIIEQNNLREDADV